MASSLRQPGAFVRINGAYIPVLSIEVYQSTFATADTFHAEVPMSALPDGCNAAYLASHGPIPATVMVTADQVAEAPQLLLDGLLTQVEFEWSKRTVRLQGKDWTAGLIRKKSREKFQNKTGLEVITIIAQRNGLKVDAPPGTLKSGKFYQIDWAHLTDQSEWAVINRVADAEGLSAYLDSRAKKLILRPPNDDSMPLVTINYTAPTPASHATGDFIGLRMVRNLEVSPKTTVTVRSWNTKQKKAVTSTKAVDGDDGEPVVYEYRAPNLTQEQADRIAEKRLLENTRHELAVEIDLPGDPAFQVRSRIKLNGTGTALDQVYYTDSVEHRIGRGEGYRMLVGARGKATKRKPA